ncbi:MAG: class I SAM-dependent methyltransferase [Cytophagales bacterium]|nr:MAG: class I SAM-dependent methyltransferase [Cytophagales bacterium]
MHIPIIPPNNPNQNPEKYLQEGIYHFVENPTENYTENFGFQWNLFEKTQIDHFSQNNQSYERFFSVTQWDKQDLQNQNILEVGAGAGRFSSIVLQHTKANLYAVDYSSAVKANYNNNQQYIPARLKLFQASVYELPFLPEQFDKVFCFGVLQHTPNPQKTIEALSQMTRKGGELIVDFYPIRGFWTKIHAKYLLRPFTKNKKPAELYQWIDSHIDQWIAYYDFFEKWRLGKICNRFVPICDLKNTLPHNLSPQQRREWALLDTFDMFSPQYDQPQKINTVKKWFEKLGYQQIFAGYIQYGQNQQVAVVKGIKS